jgi:hypothetical protein
MKLQLAIALLAASTLLAFAQDNNRRQQGHRGPPPQSMRGGMGIMMTMGDISKLPADVQPLAKQLQEKREAFMKDTEPLRKEIREKMSAHHEKGDVKIERRGPPQGERRAENRGPRGPRQNRGQK